MLGLSAGLALLLGASSFGETPQTLKVMVVFAHPDEGEIYVGGTTALFTRMGHSVKFLSLTNGDAGHFSMKPDDLAKRRLREAMEAKRILKLADYEVLDHHDGKLKDSPELRAQVAARIEDFRPDLVFTYFPVAGGHNDNMNAGWIVRGAAALLKAESMPVFLYMRDYFTTGFSHMPDVALDIGGVWDTKLRACAAHESQVVEANPHRLGVMEAVKASKQKQAEFLYDNTYPFSRPTPDNLLVLSRWYGRDAAGKARYVEAFEFAEFGRQPREADVRRLLPMLSGFIELSGRTDWLDTGIEVTRNQPIEITAEGEIVWKADGRETCGPTGADPYTRRGNKPLLSVSTGAIIGKIGADSTDYFYIGPGRSIMPFASGRLFVGINDDNVLDNDGAFRLWIRKTAGN